MDIRPEAYSAEELYKILIGAVVPRPIAWVSSVDGDGRVNVAPFSFFTVLASDPPTLGVTVMHRRGQPKDTLRNAREMGEIVVNVVTEELLEKASLTSIEAPSDFDEAQYAGLTMVPGRLVRAPVILESPVHFECRVVEQLKVGRTGENGESNRFLVAEVVHIQIDDRVLNGRYIDPTALKAVGRMGGPFYCRTTELWELKRPTYPPAEIPRLRRGADREG